ncbi:hypothetical protein S40293_00709 [Stachybotrys chartarum IBT 40293]|nr:hypothetical protein S40293_00709 [Stachybotrys chartarum IBT 40293]
MSSERDRSGDVLAVSVMTLSVATLAVSTRIGVKVHLRKLTTDDSSRLTLGRLYADISLPSATTTFRCLVASHIAHCWGIALAKASFAILYIQILPKYWLTIANKILVAFVICQAIEETMTVIFRCRPISAGFDIARIPNSNSSLLQTDQCLELTVIWWTTFAFNMCTDLFLFVQPTPSLWKLKLPVVKRIGLIVMLSLGILVCIISIVRMVYVSRIQHNMMHELVDPIICSTVELGALVTCACIPCLRQLVKMSPWLSRALGLSGKRQGRSSHRQPGMPMNHHIPAHSRFSRGFGMPKSLRISRVYFGNSSKVTTGTALSESSGSDDMVPPLLQQQGAIVVTTEWSHNVEHRAAQSFPPSPRSDVDGQYDDDDGRRRTNLGHRATTASLAFILASLTLRILTPTEAIYHVAFVPHLCHSLRRLAMDRAGHQHLRCPSQIPGLFTATGQPEFLYHPNCVNRTKSSSIEKGVLPLSGEGTSDEGQTPGSHPPDGTINGSLAEPDTAAGVQNSRSPLGRTLQQGQGGNQLKVQDDELERVLTATSRKQAAGHVQTLEFLAQCNNPLVLTLPPPRVVSSLSMATTDDGSKAATAGSDMSHHEDMDSILSTSEDRASEPADASLDSSVYRQKCRNCQCSRDNKQGGCTDPLRTPLATVEASRDAHLWAAANSDQSFVETLTPCDPAEVLEQGFFDRKPRVVSPAQRHAQQHHQTFETVTPDTNITYELVGRMHERLIPRRVLREHLHILGNLKIQLNPSNTFYLISGADIEDMVNDIITSLRGPNTHSAIVPNPIQIRKNSNTSTSLCVDGFSNAIIPCSAMGAEPATTISTPKTSFASISPSDMQVHTKIRGGTMATTTTVVSRRSVAEITWVENNSLSQPSNDAQTLQSPPYDDEACLTGFSVHHYTTADNFESLIANISRAQETIAVPYYNTGLTSFPALRSRHCTKEWLSPPTRCEGILLPPPGLDMYKDGVDAHYGAESWPPEFLLDEPVKQRQYSQTLFSGNRLFNDRSYAGHQYSASYASPRQEKRLGSSLGAAARRRRSLQAPEIDKNMVQDQGLTVPSFLTKIRGRGRRLHHHTSPSHSEDSKVPYNSPNGNHRLPTTPRSRDSLVRERTPKLPRIDRAGIYEAMTGSRLVVPRDRHDICSEDNKPHVCADDGDSFLASSVSTP